MPKLILILSLVSLNCFAIHIDTNLRLHADTVPVEIKKDHLKLSAYLSKPCRTETEKIAVFAYWIAKNIRYDLDELKRLGRNKEATEVLSNRKAVCGGFSALFQQFCSNENILCFYISGRAYCHFFKRIFSKLHGRHAWNIAYVDGEWKCIDVTWCNDLVKTPDFRKNGELTWIGMDPKKFGKTHYPYDPRWQLVEDPNTKKEFWRKKNMVERTYAYKDSLDILLNMDWVDAQLATINGQFTEFNDPETYMDQLCWLAWDLVGGFYDSTETIRAKEIFHFSLSRYQTLRPYRHHKRHFNTINTGLWLCDKRLEMKE